MIRKHCTALLICLVAAGAARGQDVDPEASPIWQKVHAGLFAGAPIAPGEGVVALEAPARAQDAATVPITIRAQFPQTADRYIDKVWLVVDNNPSPIAAIFQFTRRSGRADIETRIRVEQYTHVQGDRRDQRRLALHGEPLREGRGRLLGSAGPDAAGRQRASARCAFSSIRRRHPASRRWRA